MLRIVMLISALFVVMQLNNYVHAQITTSVAATPAEKVCAIGKNLDTPQYHTCLMICEQNSKY